MNNFLFNYDDIDTLDFDRDCLQFMTEVDKNSKDANLYRSVMYQDSITLQRFKEALEQRCRNIPNHISIEKMKEKYADNLYKYCYWRIERLEKKFQTFTLLYYSTAVDVTEKMIQYQQKAIKENKIIKCRVNEYKTYALDKYQSSNKMNIKRLLMRIGCLDCFSSRIISNIKNNTISVEKLRNEIKTASNMLQDGYLPTCQLDEYFLRFIIELGQLSLFDSTVDLVIEDSKAKNDQLNYDITINLTNKFLLLWELDSNEKKAFQITIMRLFFDRLYSKCPKFLNYQPDIDIFFSHCQELRNLTPAQLQINKSMITNEMTNTPFCEIVNLTPYLVGSIKTLQRIQYFTNPIDISAMIYKCLRGVHCFVNQNQNMKKPKKKSDNETLNMSFDDCFSIFMPLMACGPPTNCVAVAQFMFNVINLSIPSHFDFAQLLFTSAVGFIRNLKLQEFLDTKV